MVFWIVRKPHCNQFGGINSNQSQLLYRMVPPETPCEDYSLLSTINNRIQPLARKTERCRLRAPRPVSFFIEINDRLGFTRWFIDDLPFANDNTETCCRRQIIYKSERTKSAILSKQWLLKPGWWLLRHWIGLRKTSNYREMFVDIKLINDSMMFFFFRWFLLWGLSQSLLGIITIREVPTSQQKGVEVHLIVDTVYRPEKHESHLP